ncbi:MAG: hypothetical protein QM608_14600 [Caulobacter sp.]
MVLVASAILALASNHEALARQSGQILASGPRYTVTPSKTAPGRWCGRQAIIDLNDSQTPGLASPPETRRLALSLQEVIWRVCPEAESVRVIRFVGVPPRRMAGGEVDVWLDRRLSPEEAAIPLSTTAPHFFAEPASTLPALGRDREARNRITLAAPAYRTEVAAALSQLKTASSPGTDDLLRAAFAICDGPETAAGKLVIGQACYVSGLYKAGFITTYSEASGAFADMVKCAKLAGYRDCALIAEYIGMIGLYDPDKAVPGVTRTALAAGAIDIPGPGAIVRAAYPSLTAKARAIYIAQHANDLPPAVKACLAERTESDSSAGYRTFEDGTVVRDRNLDRSWTHSYIKNICKTPQSFVLNCSLARKQTATTLPAGVEIRSDHCSLERYRPQSELP